MTYGKKKHRQWAVTGRKVFSTVRRVLYVPSKRAAEGFKNAPTRTKGKWNKGRAKEVGMALPRREVFILNLKSTIGQEAPAKTKKKVEEDTNRHTKVSASEDNPK